MRYRFMNIGFGAALTVLAGMPLPAVAQGLLGLETEDAGVLSIDEINEGRFTAMGGIFGDQRIDCIRCHGLDGMGNSSGAFPRLAGQNAWYLFKTLTDYAAGRRPSQVMVPIARSMSIEEMREVAAYYASIVAEREVEAPEADIEVRQIGGAIAAVGLPRQGVPACSSCHGTQGEGLPPVNPALAGQFAPYLEHQLLLWKNGLREGDPMNVMARIASAMTEEQIEAVSLYYGSIHSEDWLTESEIETVLPVEAVVPAQVVPVVPVEASPGAEFAPDVLPPYLPRFDEELPVVPVESIEPVGGQ
ncbi:MAG TPA: c-type cytochrome [Devosia sp.]|jgi:cytochrome c553|nr:c-type cytochrome [Devosia sp.]